MCSRLYIIISKIIVIPMPFLFLIYCIIFISKEKNMKVKVIEPFDDHFRPFSSLSRAKSEVLNFSIY